MLIKQENFVEAPKGTKYVFVKYILPIVNSNIKSLEVMGGVVYKRYNWLNVVTALIPDRDLGSLRRLPEVQYVEEIPTMHALAYQGGAYKWNMSLINAEPVHPYNTGEGIKVCVTDTGIESTHPDLSSNYKGGKGFTNDPSPQPGEDVGGHGTHCAGVVAADGTNIVGVAPKAHLYSCRILGNDGSGNLAWLVDALEWCIANSMDIVSMSLGWGPQYVSAVHSALKGAFSAGLCLVAASGNSGGRIGYPAAHPEVIAVGALDQNKVRAYFSCFGNELNVAAPGVDVYSTYPGGGYKTMDGTSMACPHVAGLAALIKKADYTFTPSDILGRMCLDAEDLGMGDFDPYYGSGMIDVENTVPESGIEKPGTGPGPPAPPGPDPVDWAPSNLRVMPTGAMAGASNEMTVSQDPRVAGHLIVDGDNVTEPVELSKYASLVERGDGWRRREEEKPEEDICYGLFYNAEDISIWIGRRKGSLGAEDGFKFVDTQPLLLAREKGAPEWKGMADKEKWKEIYTRKLRHNNISVLKREDKDTAFWCTKREVKMASLKGLRTLERTKREEKGEKKEEKQMVLSKERAVYRLLNIADNDQKERIKFYEDNHIPLEVSYHGDGTWDLRTVCPAYWMPMRAIIKKPEAWVANYKIENGEKWKYIAVVEELAVRPSGPYGGGSMNLGNFGDGYFKQGIKDSQFEVEFRYCNTELSLYGCTDLNFKDEWKWLSIIGCYPYVVATWSNLGAYAGVAPLFNGLSFYNNELDFWLMKEYHPADGMIQESVALDKEGGSKYLYTMFAKTLKIDEGDSSDVRPPSGSYVKGKMKDFAGGVLYKVKEYPYSYYTIGDYEKKSKFRVFSYEDDRDAKKEAGKKRPKLDITDNLRILGIHWSHDRMRIHPELKDREENRW